MIKSDIAKTFKALQNSICQSIEKEDTARFKEDLWDRAAGGGGCSRVISDGNTFEKGGVLFSEVHGKTPDKVLQALNLPPTDFYATGISLIIHPVNPWVPIVHMNLRYFEMTEGSRWFGGGIDLTPHYVNKEDAQFFHAKIKEVCNQHNKLYYKEFKTWADNYFYNRHRKETRGVGGIFFDKLSGNDAEMEAIFAFIKAIGNLFSPLYLELVKRNKQREYGEKERAWQLLRRGRYVEFNLLYDKGTKFGLDTGGRIESILASMPPLATWEYNFLPEPGSEEEKTLEILKIPVEWL